ncbi:Polynucleotidyl transferase- ribonuclease H-like superfamily protein [Striga hermonthica]|uniref:Polynucleotidyl transferase- ribonuclease H-like superfamily protein n=1 Tax=Striga hermonthica TaxID=68872 RepID=A0A9N7R522_STRHE|nr:Polynucleotidyl transferase- ribonuclease H-like superfamily protein [Striga hermonthica]
MPRPELGPDRLYWGFSSTGKFTTKSAYDMLDAAGKPETASTLKPVWRAVWQWPGPQCIRIFLWLLTKNRLLTNVERRRRHLTADGICAICGQTDETILHALRDCSLAAEAWRDLLPRPAISDFFCTDLVQWISSNLLNSLSVGGANWACIFGVAAWKIWKWRNEFIFQGKRRTGIGGVHEILTYVEGLKNLIENDRKLGGSGRVRMERWIRWEKPPAGWVG